MENLNLILILRDEFLDTLSLLMIKHKMHMQVQCPAQHIVQMHIQQPIKCYIQVQPILQALRAVQCKTNTPFTMAYSMNNVGVSWRQSKEAGDGEIGVG